jgi:mono/diheme cytochrome c family protein
MARNLWSLPLFLAAACCAWGADAQRGATVLQNEGCLGCHSVRGAGGEGGVAPRTRTAPDLGKSLAPAYTAPALAATLWDHTPAMWAEMSARVMARPAPSEADWQDVFAYLYSLQFFEPPALARRGGRLFEIKHCADCHSMESDAPGKPVPAWARLDDPVTLLYQMWNHASSMKKEFAGRKEWSKLTGRDLLNLTVYFQSVQNLPRNSQFSLPDPASGRSAEVEHCAQCHTGPQSLAILLQNKTWMDIGAGLWNHVPLLQSVPVISEADMRGILAYVWELQYRGPEGRVTRGERLFEDKGCISCHRSPSPKASAMSPRAGKTFTPFSMVALGWGSGREMHRQMQEKGVRWPHLSPEDVSNLVAYMNTLNR